MKMAKYEDIDHTSMADRIQVSVLQLEAVNLNRRPKNIKQAWIMHFFIKGK